MSRPALLRALEHVRATAGRPAPLADDQLLMRFVTDHDEAAFAELVRRHGPLVLGVARRQLADAHEADDVLQGTFLALARHAARVGGRPLAPWLFTVAYRLACKARARAARRPGPTHNEIAVIADPLATLTARELVAALDEELARLPERYRLPLVLCGLDGLTRDEAAMKVGWSLGSLRGRLERGRELLRRRLAARGLEVPAVLAGGLLVTPAEAMPASLVRSVVRAAIAVPSAGVPIKLTIAATVFVLAIGVGGGMTLLPSGQPQPKTTPPTPPATVSEWRVDSHGDPLPDGAILRLGTTRLRHSATFAVAFTATNKLVSCGRDYILRVWDPVTGKQISERAFEKSYLQRNWAGSLSGDGQRLAIQLGEKIKVFDAESGLELASVKLASVFEAMAAFAPDGRHLAVVDQDGNGHCTIQLCDIEANACRVLAPIKSWQSAPVFSRDGRRVALAMATDGVMVWELPTGRELARFRSKDLCATSVDFDASGDVVAALGSDPGQSLHFFRISTGGSAEDWITPRVKGIYWTRFAPDGSTLLLGGEHEPIRWFDPKAGKTIRVADGAASRRPAFSADGRLLASERKNVLDIWDASTGRSVVPVEFREMAEEIQGLTISPDDKWLLTSGDGGTTRVWDFNGRQSTVIRSIRPRGGRHLVSSSDGRSLYGEARDAVAMVRCDFPGGTENARYKFADPAADQVGIYNFGLSADGRRLAALTQTINHNPAPLGVGGWFQDLTTLTVWNTATTKRIESRLVKGPTFLAYGAFSPDLRWYFMGDQPISLAGNTEFHLDLPEGWVKEAAVSRDGRIVAHVVEQAVKDEKGNNVAFTSPGVNLHETATGRRIFNLPTDMCGAIAFTPDSRGLIVTDPNAITRWDLVTRKPVVRHKAPGRFVGSYGYSFASALAVTPDGTRAVTGHIDTTVLVWSLPPPARRVLTLTERELNAAWADLSEENGGKAYAAIWSMADGAAEAVPFLRDHLRPAVAPPEERVRELVARLDSPAFEARDAAEKDLLALGDVAAPTLRALSKARLSVEQTQRVGRILAGAEVPTLPPGDRLRQIRAVAALEGAGTETARKLLIELAGGAPSATPTRAAAEALKRLDQR